VTELTTRDTKLIQYLNEAYGKEKELETSLEAHIGMTSRAPYRKRLQQHLSETKRHARELERRIKRLGGVPEVVTLPGPDAISQGASAAVELGSRALAAAKAPLQAIRGTGEQEKMLKNAKSEYSDEHDEIATYSAIEVLANALGDTDTSKLARAIRREEERMAAFLQRLIPALTKAVVQEEVPARERTAARGTAKRTSSKPTSAKRAGAKRASAKRTSAKRTSAKRTSAKQATAKRATAKRTGAKDASAKRTTTAAKSTAAKSRSKAKPASRTAAKKSKATAKASSSARTRGRVKTTAKRKPAKAGAR
jgi:ferritin-like metal-binding protein YciE